MSLPAADRPVSLDRLWPDHPAVIADRVMAEVGRAAASGQSPAGMKGADLRRLAHKEPLAVEPFLVEGALAQLAGRDQAAERLFVEARRRDPRSPAARYFLGSRYLQTDRIPEGLKEVAFLSRLVSGADAQFVPALVAYARSPGAVPHLKQFFASSPKTEDAVLTHLANDPDNAGLILTLASPAPRSGAMAAPDWHKALVQKLVEDGQYASAHAIWARLAGVPAAGALFNPRFAPSAAPPPFNWTFASGSAGVAEPSDKGLKTVFYGREDAVLASQLLVLPPGRYRLSSSVSSAPPAAGLAWSLTCQGSKQKIAALPIAASPPPTRLAVPPSGCAAQLLELKATASEGAQTVELTIPRIDLAKEAMR